MRLQLQLGHSDLVTSAVFSPDGRRVLTGSKDQTACIWEVATGREYHRLEGHSDSVTRAAFSSVGRLALTGSADGTSRLWDSATGRELATLVSLREGGRLVTTPEGRFDTGDSTNTRGIHWVRESEVILPEQLDLRPDSTPGLLGIVMSPHR